MLRRLPPPKVEDTLNNSNDLFLTFRKEMEDMSKKTKRLEKENLQLTRKHDATNRNIIEMAEERSRSLRELELANKKIEHLERLCRGMQAQGRGQAGAETLDAAIAAHSDSSSEYEYDDDDHGSADGDYDEDDDDTEEETVARAVGAPPPPPPPPSQAHLNGNGVGQRHGHANNSHGHNHSTSARSTKAASGTTNGVKH